MKHIFWPYGLAVILLAGCGEAASSDVEVGTLGAAGASGTAGGGPATPGTAEPPTVIDGIDTTPGPNAREPEPLCMPVPGATPTDADADGFTVAAGDCNDCSASVNPGAYDYPMNQVDEDCSGTPDDEAADCGAALPVQGDAAQAARALGICRVATQGSWGLVTARYAYPDGTASTAAPEVEGCTGEPRPPHPKSHAILSTFGSVLPRHGGSLVSLSTGEAEPDEVPEPDKGFDPKGMCTTSGLPDGFPVGSFSTCGDIERTIEENSAKIGNDAIALELVIRAPTNARALSFDFNFHTIEYPGYVCTEYNDYFVALLYSQAPDVPRDNNIAFDSTHNPVSVNNGFLEACAPFTYNGTKAGAPFTRGFDCSLGQDSLQGTNFEEHGATGWLQTLANIVPGEELTLRFAIWDAGDHALDSTVLLDNFQWDVMPGEKPVTRRPPDIIR